MSHASTSKCGPAQVKPADDDVANEEKAESNQAPACRRLPCPHCILGVRHAANMEEVMSSWEQKVWDYSRAGSMPDEGYWMRLMACQWISTLNVKEVPMKTTKKKERGAAMLTPREIETSKRPLGLPKGPDFVERNANHIAKSEIGRASCRERV
jgi:hypothetical protein